MEVNKLQGVQLKLQSYNTCEILHSVLEFSYSR